MAEAVAPHRAGVVLDGRQLLVVLVVGCGPESSSGSSSSSSSSNVLVRGRSRFRSRLFCAAAISSVSIPRARRSGGGAAPCRRRGAVVSPTGRARDPAGARSFTFHSEDGVRRPPLISVSASSSARRRAVPGASATSGSSSGRTKGSPAQASHRRASTLRAAASSDSLGECVMVSANACGGVGLHCRLPKERARGSVPVRVAPDQDSRSSGRLCAQSSGSRARSVISRRSGPSASTECVSPGRGPLGARVEGCNGA